MNKRHRVIENLGTKRSGTSTPLRRRILFSAFALGLSTLCAVIFSELVLRVFVDQEAKRLATYDKTLGWRGRPGGNGVYVRKSENICVPFYYNNLGFRGDDVGPKQQGKRRLLMLGDSFVENLEVEYASTFPALVEQSLRESSPEWEVTIVGSQGYSTAQELLAFRRFEETLSPDLVLLCFYSGNDYEDNLRRRFAFLDESGELHLPINQEATWKHMARAAQRWLYESSHLVFLAKNVIQQKTDIKLAPASKHAEAADEIYKQDLTLKLVNQLALEVRDANAGFGVIVIPFRDDLANDLREPTDLICRFCVENGIPHLDLWPHLSLTDYFDTDIHFDVEGHQNVAGAVCGFLEQAQMEGDQIR